MPQYIGVSQAVLDNVIFCHQDESLWPMSEPAALKKKFDEIFEALKWTAAMKNINELQKNQKQLLGNHEFRYETEKVNKDRGDREQRKAERLYAEIDKLRKQHATLIEDIDAALKMKDEKWKQATKALGIVDQLKVKQQRAENLQENIDNLEPNLQQLQESDEWLKSTLERYDERKAQYEEKRKSLLSQYQDVQSRLSTSRQQLSNKQAEMGQHLAEKESHERQIKVREQLVKVAAHQHSLRGYDGDLEEDQIREFIERVQKLSSDKDRELERIKRATEDELNEIQTRLNELDKQKSLRTQERMVAKQTIAENDKRRKFKEREANSIEMDEAGLKALESAKADAQKSQRKLNDDFERAAWDKHIKAENIHQVELESEHRKLRDEYRQNSKLAADRVELEYVQKQAKDTRSKLDVLKSTHAAKLGSVLGTEFEWANVAHEFEAVLSQRVSAVEDAKRLQQQANDAVLEVELKLKQARARLAQKKEEKKKRQAYVLISITSEDGIPLADADDYIGELKTLEDTCKDIQNSLDGMDYVAKYYKTCQKTLATTGMCQLCERPFVDMKVKSAAMDKIKRELEKLKRDTLESELKSFQKDLSTALAARSDYEIYKNLCIEIPDLEKEIRDIEKSKSPLVNALEVHDAKVQEKVSSQSETEALAAHVKTITEYTKGLAKFDTDIETRSSQQKLSGSRLTNAEIEEQQAVCDERLRLLRLKIEKLADQKDQAKAAIASLDIELSNITNKLNTASHELEKKQNLISDIEELRTSNVKLLQTIQIADADLESLLPLFENTSVLYDDARKRGHAKEREVQSEKDKLAGTTNKFKLVGDDINRYVEEGGPEKLAACERAIKVMEQDQKRLDSEVAHVTADNNEIKNLLDDSERTRRSIIDNIQYRKHVRDLAEVKIEIADLDSRSVTDDYAQLKRQAAKADEQYTLLGVEKASVWTSINHMDNELRESLELWNTDYKDAAENYREARIKVETTKAAIDDLGKYSKALEAAIMKYHSVKMEEINQIAGELWRQTYQGSDVDTIMIRSENDNATSKRSYDYRVVMVKSNAEMDMRGRCSAGQKVLASIIIRLALAECFGVNCGVSFPLSKQLWSACN